MNIIIRGVNGCGDLVSALSAVTNSALRQDFFEEEEMVFARADIEDVPTAEELSQMVGLDSDLRSPLCDQGVATQLELPFPDGRWQIPGPLKYVPCPQKGQHEHLTDCWMCWGDALLVASTGARLAGAA